MAFLSVPFLCFFPITALLYFLLPQRVRNYWLLAASWFFYLSAKPIYLTLLLFVIVTSYITGIALERCHHKGILILCLAMDVVLLFLFKYINFALSLIAEGLSIVGITWSAPMLDIVLPIGISFYLFQAMGYVLDVWWGKVKAQQNFVLHGLFLSFFPQLVSGPIGRAAELTPQFQNPHSFCWDRFRKGMVRFLWGAFKKMLLADRLAVLVNTVYAAPETFGALQLVGAAVAFSFQIYCDFSSYTDMALGVADSMGFTLRENFNTPYFSRSISEFWRRWHMSLSNWFRDYLYIPLGGSRRGTLRKYLNVLIVFAVSGLWHGAALTFVVWGILNGVYQVIGGMTMPVRNGMYRMLRIEENGTFRKGVQIVATFLLTTVAWVFFKASSLSNAFQVLSGMFHGPLWVYQSVGLDRRELLVAFVALVILFAVDVLGQRYDLKEQYLHAPRLVRWMILWALLFGCLIFGCYGAGYNAQDFLYGFSF